MIRLFSTSIFLFFATTTLLFSQDNIDVRKYLIGLRWEYGQMTKLQIEGNQSFLFKPCNPKLDDIKLQSLDETKESDFTNCPKENNGHAGAPIILNASLKNIHLRGVLKCGVSAGRTGFATVDANGVWSGFDISFCRAVAAAVLDDPQAVEFTATKYNTQFTMLASGEVDLLARGKGLFNSDVSAIIESVGVNYYDGQGFLVPTSLGVTSAKDLNNVDVCVKTNTTSELNLNTYFEKNNIKYQPIYFNSSAEGKTLYLSNKCDVYTDTASDLAIFRATLDSPEDYTVLPEIISKEPTGPLVRQGDNEWADIVHWTLNALTVAEELGITSDNISELVNNNTSPAAAQFLSAEGNLGEQLGLKPDWARNVIAATGNYGEIYEGNIGEKTPIGIARGLNAQWTSGGLIYSAPFR